MDKREKKETAPLNKLYTILKGNLFQHQVFFYYILFQVWQVNVSEKDIENYVKKLREQIKKLYADEIKEKDLIESEEAKKFYVFLINMPETEKLEKSCYPEFKGNFVEQEKTNINKTINGKRSIPYFWKEKFGNIYINRMSYVHNLAWLLQYLYVFQKCSRAESLADKGKEINEEDGNYVEYFTFNHEIWEKISDEIGKTDFEIGKKVNSFEILAEVIYKALFLQSNDERWISEKVTEAGTTEKRNLAKERKQYENIIDGYGTKNIDRFNMLSRYAEENMYCASELGDIYYYGDVFYSGGVEGEVKIERDYDKASHYYSLCSQEPNVVPNACWSLGYMILHKKSEENLNDVEREKRAIEYFERCGNYGPAKNSLANIYKGQGDKLYSEKFLSSAASEEDKKEVIDCYVKFINYAYEAHLFQWTYAKNALYAFLADEQYQPLLVALRKDPRYIHVEGIKLLQESATLGNVWAMDRLACHYIAEVIRKSHENGNGFHAKTNYLLFVLRGECTVAQMSGVNCAELEETLKEAKRLLEEAHQQNYGRATFHLALNFSRNSDERTALLNMAASRGEKQAKDKLKEFQS